MKITEHELRKLIREEFLTGIPEFVLRQASGECVDKIRQHMKRFIQMRASNPTHSREMLQKANDTLNELDTELYKLIEEKLWSFIQRT